MSVRRATATISLLLLLSILPNAIATSAQPKIGSKAPDFQLTTPYGYDVTLADLTSGGKPLVMVFFAYYCPHCRAELNQLSTEWKYCPNSDKANVLLVGVSGDPDADREVFESLGVEGWEFAEGTEEIVTDYRVMYVPTVIVVSPDGVVRFTRIGPTQPNEVCDLVGKYYNPNVEESGYPSWVIPAAVLAIVALVAVAVKFRGRRRKRTKKK